ncbi:hypothetical protein EXIGLDRAFT_729456, partial [Exidia glandulosa HHB12029]
MDTRYATGPTRARTIQVLTSVLQPYRRYMRVLQVKTLWNCDRWLHRGSGATRQVHLLDHYAQHRAGWIAFNARRATGAL